MNQTDISTWHYLGLDEWGGMNGSDEGSCRYHLNNQLFDQINRDDEKICFFDGRAENLEEECSRVEMFIQQQGGIDVAILGLGMNGHIGMNEPGTSLTLRSHVADIDPQTQKIGQKYFKQEVQLNKGVTLGIATLLEAKHIMLLVSGANKAEIVYRILNEDPSEQLPATLIKDHPGLKVYLDKGAAKLLQQ
jgi:galactosamine-6-phosphate isomerase